MSDLNLTCCIYVWYVYFEVKKDVVVLHQKSKLRD